MSLSFSKPAKATPKLYLPDSFAIGRNLITVTNRVVHADGVIRPYVPGQWVKVEVYLGSQLIKTDHLRQKPSKRPVEENCINPHKCGGYMMVHEKMWENFVLSLDYKIAPKCNSRTSGSRPPTSHGPPATSSTSN